MNRGRDPWQSNGPQAQRSARELLRFIAANMEHLRAVDKDGSKEKAVRDLQLMVDQGETFTPNQLSYIEGLYEKTMEGLGFGSCNVHSDRRKRSLRYE